MVSSFKIFDSDALKNIRTRVVFSITIFLIVYFSAFGRIVDIMIFNKSTIIKTEKKEIYQRGKIFDRNGYLLASTIKTYSLAANPQEIQDDHCNYTISSKLENITSIPKEKINLNLLKDKKFVWIKRNISPKEHQQIINLGKIGLRTELEYSRIYPFKESTSHVVGYTRIDGIGQGGIEKGLDKQLILGEDVILSIDSRLQELVRKDILNTMNKYSAEAGLAIILDIHSGEILSMNSLPDFDPNNNKTFIGENLFNRTIQGNYEMGSTFKTITMAIGLEENIINSDLLIDVSNPIKVGKYRIKDYHPFEGELNIKGIIVKSSNIGTAKIAERIGKNKQKDFFNKLGFFKKIDLEIDETVIPLANPNNWGKLETMTIGYGHGFAITPLHLIKAYASLVNEGKIVEPTLLKKENKMENNKRIIKFETSNTIKKLLRAVILETEYTGPRIKIEGYDIGGKTGTAELIDISGKYVKDANRTAFISVFPIYDPKYAILAIIDNPKKIKEENYSITAATVVAPLVKKIILNMIKVIGIPPNYSHDMLKANLSRDLIIKKNVTF